MSFVLSDGDDSRVGFHHNNIILIIDIQLLNQYPSPTLLPTPSHNIFIITHMQKTTTVLNLASFVLTPIRKNISSLTLILTNSEQETLIQKEVKVICRNEEGRVPLGFKISFTPSQTQVFIRLCGQDIEPMDPFPVDLDLLASTSTQSYKASNNLIVRLNIEHPNFKPSISLIKPTSISSNEEFIKQREHFLERFRQNNDKQQRAMLKTPEFHRQSPPKDQCGFRHKVEELLAQARQLKNEKSRLTEGDQFRRKSEPYQHSPRNQHRSIKLPQQYQQECIEQHPGTVIHQHYHHHNIEKYSSPYKLLHQPKPEIKNIFCRTNDSYSISSQQEHLISPRSLFNAKLPIRKPAH